jgi:hypothetical protein
LLESQLKQAKGVQLQNLQAYRKAVPNLTAIIARRAVPPTLSNGKASAADIAAKRAIRATQGGMKRGEWLTRRTKPLALARELAAADCFWIRLEVTVAILGET